MLASVGFIGSAATAGPMNDESTLAMAASQDDITDKDITRAVESELLFEAATSGVEATDVEVNTADGVVTLTGTTENLLTKDRSTRIAQSVRGVRAVVNRVTVLPAERPDMEIASAVLDALETDPATEAWDITVLVSDGMVTLDGTVDSWQEKQLAARVTKGVDGVIGIENDVVIDLDAQRADEEIEEEVDQVLRWDARVGDGLIDINVDDGRVELTGTVGSAYERYLALNDAYVKGVTEVDVSDLKVRWWARDEMRRTEWASERTDEQIEKAVTAALTYDPRVFAFDVNVKVLNGTATLTGEVDNLKAKMAAAQDARNTVGVWAVENNLFVSPEVSAADAVVSDAVAARLALDPLVDASEIAVTVDAGVTTLTGEVDTYFQKWEATDVVARVPGVTTVENALAVESPPLPYELLFYDWDPVIYDVDYITPETKTDEELRRDIDQELWWSPFVDEEDITVTVQGGIATLTGTVETFSERIEAMEEAYEAGALGVENNINVVYGPESGS